MVAVWGSSLGCVGADRSPVPSHPQPSSPHTSNARRASSLRVAFAGFASSNSFGRGLRFLALCFPSSSLIRGLDLAFGRAGFVSGERATPLRVVRCGASLFTLWSRFLYRRCPGGGAGWEMGAGNLSFPLIQLDVNSFLAQQLDLNLHPIHNATNIRN